MKNPFRILVDHKGLSAIILPFLVILAMEAIAFFSLPQSMSPALRYVSTKSYMHEHANVVFEHISRSLAVGSSPHINLDSIYKFGSPASSTVVTDNLSVLESILGDSPGKKNYKKFKLILSRIPDASDAVVGGTTLRASLTLLTQSIDLVPVLKLEQEKIFNIQIGNLARFSLFFQNQREELIVASEGSSLFIYGDVLKAGNRPLKLNLFMNPNYKLKKSQVLFLGKVLTQGNIEIEETDSVENSLSIFKGGIFSKSFSTIPSIPSMGSEAAWNQNIDYKYVYSNSGYPLPGGLPKVTSFGSGNDYSQSRANLNVFPNQVLKKLGETCQEPDDYLVGSVRPMILFRKNQNITLNMENFDDRYFCGMVVANQLKIKVKDGELAVLIGHFNVSQLILEGKGRVYIINPFSSREVTSDIALPASMTLSNIARQLFALKASTAKNFFVPFSQNPGGLPVELKPVALWQSNFFEDCDGNTRMCWKQEIPLWSYDSLYAKPGWYKSVRFFVDQTL